MFSGDGSKAETINLRFEFMRLEQKLIQLEQENMKLLNIIKNLSEALCKMNIERKEDE